MYYSLSEKDNLIDINYDVLLFTLLKQVLLTLNIMSYTCTILTLLATEHNYNCISYMVH